MANCASIGHNARLIIPLLSYDPNRQIDNGMIAERKTKQKDRSIIISHIFVV